MALELSPRDDWPARVAKNAGLACLLEATAPKPGQCPSRCRFPGAYVSGFRQQCSSDRACDRARSRGARLGRSVRDCIAATREAVGTNTNLGAVLLLVPLAMVPQSAVLNTGAKAVLDHLNAEDAQLVYEAIRLAQPGGMGKVEEADVTGPAPADLRHAMQLAADRDLIARQYTNGLADVFEVVVPAIRAGVAEAWRWPTRSFTRTLRR